jgi:hypothetical protein
MAALVYPEMDFDDLLLTTQWYYVIFLLDDS